MEGHSQFPDAHLRLHLEGGEEPRPQRELRVGEDGARPVVDQRPHPLHRYLQYSPFLQPRLTTDLPPSRGIGGL